MKSLKIVSVVAALAVVSFGGVAAANLLQKLTWSGATSVLLDGGVSSDTQTMPLANRGVQCNVPATVSGNIATVNIIEQVSNDGVTFLNVADAGPVTSSDGGVTANYLTITPQPFQFVRLGVNGSLPVGSMNCTSLATDLP